MPHAIQLKNASILIPTRNRPSILAITLQELRRKGLGDSPLWIYDDASENPKAVERTVLEVWPNANLIHGENRMGQAGARNALMRACGTEFGIMLDDDEYFLVVAGIEKHLTQFQEDQGRAAVLFKCIAKTDGLASPPGIARAQEVSSFMGGNVLFHIPSILSVGGYREFFVYGYEEPDLAFRLFRKGFHIWYDPSIVVEHNQWYSPSEHRDFREYDHFYSRNSVLLATMNMPIWLGLPIGTARSVRRAFHHRRNYGIKLKGLLEGVCVTFSRWRHRTPMSAG